MPQVELEEQLFQDAQQHATDGGFSSVGAYIADVVKKDISDFHAEDNVDIDRLFTPERMKHIEKADTQIESGHFYTAEQADTEFAKRRAEWLQKNPQ